MRQNHLGFLEYTRDPTTNTGVVSDHTYQWGPSVK